MYLVLNSTDAARSQNSSALPNAPQVLEPARPARLATLAAYLLARAAAAQLRLADRLDRHARPRTTPALSHQ